MTDRDVDRVPMHVVLALWQARESAKARDLLAFADVLVNTTGAEGERKHKSGPNPDTLNATVFELVGYRRMLERLERLAYPAGTNEPAPVVPESKPKFQSPEWVAEQLAKNAAFFGRREGRVVAEIGGESGEGQPDG